MVKVLSMNKDKYNFNPRLDLRQISGIAIIIAAMVLISMQVHRTKPLKVADPVEQLQTDRNTANLMGLSGAQLIPGLSVGRIRLGESAEFLRSLLGKPQLGDAAMCKSWERWEWGGGQQVLEIFESCDAKQDMKKTVQQIRFSGLSFGTREGIFLKSTFAKIRQQFPDLTAVAVFTDKSTGRPMIIMDQISQGIAFVMDAKNNQPDPQGKCRTIIIHMPGKKAVDTYLQPQWDLHPLE